MNRSNFSDNKMPRDSLGDRMKSQYESRTRYALPRRTYTILRVDGKAFHTYTRDCERPFDAALMRDMDLTAIALCEQIEGAQFAYVQSDEISLLPDGLSGHADASLVRRQHPEDRFDLGVDCHGAV